MKIFHLDFNTALFYPQYLKQILPKLRNKGFDTLIWELEGYVKWDSCPESAAADAISKADLKELLDYAENIGFRNAPLLQTLGHCEYVLSNEKYTSFRENPEETAPYCPLAPGFREFIRMWINEYCSLFRNAPFFHLGCDETWHLAEKCPHCQPEGRVKVLSGHIRFVSECVRKQNITPAIWADMLLIHPDALNLIPKDTILFDWRYEIYPGCGGVWIWDEKGGHLTPESEIPESAKKIFGKWLYPENGSGKADIFYTSAFLKEAGFKVVLCSSASSAGGDNLFIGRYDMHRKNILAVHEAAKKCFGEAVTSWTIHLHPYEFQPELFPETADPAFEKGAEYLKEASLFTSARTSGYDKTFRAVAENFIFRKLAEFRDAGILESERKNSERCLPLYRQGEAYFHTLLQKGENPLYRRAYDAARLLIHRAECVLLLTSEQPEKAKAEQLLAELEQLAPVTEKQFENVILPERRKEYMRILWTPLRYALKKVIEETKKHKICLLSALLIPAALSSCAELTLPENAELQHMAEEEATIPIAPGGVNGSPFWNGCAKMFLAAPAFDFPAVPGSQTYRYTVTDASGKKHVFSGKTPKESLTPVWKELPVGFADLTVEGVDSNGKLTVSGKRRFYRSAVFPGIQRSPERSWNESAKMALHYVYSRPFVQYWLKDGTPDPSYNYYTYPAKIYSALAEGMILYSNLVPENRENAMKIAEAAATFLIRISQPAGAPLEYFPPTYRGSEMASKTYAGQQMLLYPAEAGLRYLLLYEKTKKQEYLDAAVRIAATYRKLQLPCGTWYLKLREADGKPVCENLCFPFPMIPFFERLAELGHPEFLPVRDRALAYLEENFMKKFQWDGQFEDGEPRKPYQNLTMHCALDYAIYLMQKGQTDRVLPLIRFAEDQFCIWEKPMPTERKERSSEEFITPCGLEQYDFYVPVDASCAKLIHAWLCYRQKTGDVLALAKAAAMANGITFAQNSTSGKYPTFYEHNWRGQEEGWINCAVYTAGIMLKMHDTFPGLYPVKEKSISDWEQMNKAVKTENRTDDGTLPRVLILGDSISLGYTPIVMEELKNRAYVARPGCNCGPSQFYLKNLDEWTGTKQWDVIHVNFGIWDNHYMDKNGELLRTYPPEIERAPSPEARAELLHKDYVIRTPERVYEANLRTILRTLQKRSRHVVFALTTPVPLWKNDDRYERIPRYNDIARKVCKELNIEVNDLYSVGVRIPHKQTDGCHFTFYGYVELAENVRKAILNNLEK